jgi:two-component system response regulator PilR (NtrC family)
MKQPLALIVDDEPDILHLLGITLSRMNIHTQASPSLVKAYALLSEYSFDFCLTDMRLGDGNGIELIEYIQKHHPSLPVALITAHGNMDTAIAAMKAGAFDFLSKPIQLTQLRALINNGIQLKKKQRTKIKMLENGSSNDSISSNQSTPFIAVHSSNHRIEKPFIGDSPVMQTLKTMIIKLAHSQASVFIYGESGTGKELVARLIHHQGSQSDGPFIAVNCGAIPYELIESEFFGHVKGSFTGAIRDKKGFFQMAHHGTLFLDEIAELPLLMQVKLLRAIQEKTIRPVGSEKEIAIKVRILSASHKALEEQVKQGLFRNDLYYRINVIELKVPSLKERKSDIPKLIHYLIQKIAPQKSKKYTFSHDALTALMEYTFPGNIRELENILERTLLLTEHFKITQHDLHLPLSSSFPFDSKEISYRGDYSLDRYLENIEKKEILIALKKTKGNKTKAAEILGISFRAMRYKLNKLKIESSEILAHEKT